MPFKDFAVGAILPAADVDTYLMRQTVMTFATSAARDSALSGVLDEGMVAYMEDAPNRLMYYTGSTWRYIQSDAVAFTPSWANLTVGNGSQAASYQYAGPNIFITLRLVLGSTSTVGTSPSFALPNAHTAVGDHAGPSAFYDSTAAQLFSGGWSVNNAGSAVSVISAAGFLTATVPFTWAISDEIKLSGHIRVDS